MRLEISPLPGLVFSDRDSHSPSNRLGRADRRLPASGRPRLFCVNDIEKIGGNHSLHAATRANIPTSPYGSRRLRAKWNTRNRRTKAVISQSNTPQLRSGRKLTGKRPSPHGRSGRRWAASRSLTNWFAATARAMIWLRVSSSGGIADVASVLVNAMGLRQRRRRLRSRSSFTTM